jgi:hypothetical protein
VVSEETGAISLARAGHLTENIAAERLSRFLDAFYHTHIQTTATLIRPWGAGS